MSTTQDHTLDAFVVTGLLAHDAGILLEALKELAERLDDAGAGPTLDAWAAERHRAVGE